MRSASDTARVAGPWLMLGLVLPAWVSGCNTREKPPSDAASARTGSEEIRVPAASPFVDVTEAVGLAFSHTNGMTGQLYFVEMMGSGGALFDYDGDGDLDLYAVQGHPLDTGPSPAYADRLFHNTLAETGTLGFTDVTQESGLRATGYGMGVATADYDGDGFVDVYVLNWGANQLWRNRGEGRFEDATAVAGVDDGRWSVGGSFFDYDRDGHLDLMVVNYAAYTLQGNQPCYARSGRQDYCGPAAYPDESDGLFRNRGDGTFENATEAMGLTTAYGSGLGVVAADFNGDAWLDLAVANDADDNQLWINQAGQRFDNQAVMAGVAVNAVGSREAGMGVNAADFDSDGDDDLFMTHLSNETNTLYLNTGQALFEDRTRHAGLGPPSLRFTAFGVAPLDYDNDGWLDLFIANGEVKIISEQDANGEALPLRQSNQLFRNLGQGRFEETTPPGDAVFEIAEVSRGVAYGDVDNDGDTDLVVFNNNGPARLLRNEVGQHQAWLGLELVAADGRRSVPGTRVAVVRSGGPTLWRRVHTDGSYASAHDPRVLLGLGHEATYDAVRVYWFGGAVEEWNGLAVHRYHRLMEGQGKPVARP